MGSRSWLDHFVPSGLGDLVPLGIAAIARRVLVDVHEKKEPGPAELAAGPGWD